MSKPAPQRPASAAAVAMSGTAGSTPVVSSPPASEAFFSEFEGTASMLDTSFGEVAAWDPPADASALNIVSWKLGVDAHVDDGVEKRGFNAISTVLAHPTKRANPLRASRKPLPPLGAPPLLPRPQPQSYYDSYLKSIGPLYETFVQSQAAATATGASPQSELDLQSKSAKADLPSLDSIPAVFFNSGFDIANPSTWADIMSSSDGSSTEKRDSAVQESLSTHLDNLEAHLVHEITLRSSSFFSALSNLQDLNSESSSCLERISNLKSALGEVGGKQARKGLEIIDAQARLRALRITEGGIKRVAELDDVLRIARSLADGGDWGGALGCVEEVVRWWEKNGKEVETEDSPSHLPLTSLPALANLPTSISMLTANIAGQLEGVLSTVLLSALSSDEQAPFDSQALRSSVGPMLGGFVRCGKAEALGEVWRGAVTLAIREGLRQHLPIDQGEDEGEVDDKAPEARGQTLAQRLQAMSHGAFVELCKKMYGSMLARLHLVQQMGEEMAAMLAENKDATVLAIAPSLSLTKASDATSFDFSEYLTGACELANTRASKIVSVRLDQHAALPIDQFMEMFNQSWSFVVATEVLAKRMIVSLRGVTASQARTFLISYHGERLTKSAKLVEEETWVQIDVPQDTQKAVDRMVEAAVSDPVECFIPPREANGTANGEHKAVGPAKLLNIEDKPFCLVKATSESLQLLSDYLTVVINLELVVTDVMARIIEFLKSFNSRTCQVVLGAGAMRSAGLKNITAKHLALASQSLSAVVTLIPYVREFIRRHLNPRQAVMLVEFDKLKRDFLEHQNEIHAKLVAIMADRLAVHCNELRGIDWEATPTREGPNNYALMLAKETATLHKVLSKYLSVQTVEVVMSQVIAASVQRLGDEYGKVELKSEEGRKRMLQDAAILASRLEPLSETGSTAASLEALVREKSMPRKPVGQAMRGLLRKSSNEPSPSPAAPSAPAEADTPGDEEGPTAASATPEARLQSPQLPERQNSRGWREISDAPEAPSPRASTPIRVSTPARSPSPTKAFTPPPSSPKKVFTPPPSSPSRVASPTVATLAQPLSVPTSPKPQSRAASPNPPSVAPSPKPPTPDAKEGQPQEADPTPASNDGPTPPPKEEEAPPPIPQKEE